MVVVAAKASMWGLERRGELDVIDKRVVCTLPASVGCAYNHIYRDDASSQFVCLARRCDVELNVVCSKGLYISCTSDLIIIREPSGRLRSKDHVTLVGAVMLAKNRFVRNRVPPS